MGIDLVDMQLIRQFNKGFRFLLCAIDIYSKYAWVFPSNSKKGITITNALQKKFNEWKHKTNKIWVDKGSENHNRSMKSLLQKNDIKMYSTHNEGKSVIAERLIRTLTWVSKNAYYIDELDDIVNKCKNTYHSTINMKPTDVKPNTCIDSSKEINNKDAKIKIGDIIRISK